MMEEDPGGLPPATPSPFLTRPSFAIYSFEWFPSFYKMLTLDPPSKIFFDLHAPGFYHGKFLSLHAKNCGQNQNSKNLSLALYIDNDLLFDCSFHTVVGTKP